MKVSIITVCFNSSSTIDRCLSSVSSQTYYDYEHIIIDGASNDETINILNLRQHPKLFVYSEPDDGIYDAMNKGLAHVSGDVICFLNSDDFFAHENIISNIVNIFRKKDIDIVLGDVDIFSGEDVKKTIRRYPALRFRPSLLRFGWMPPHPGFFALKKVYSDNGFFDVHYKIAGDFEFMCRVFQPDRYKYCYANETVVRMQQGGISTSGFRSFLTLNLEVMRACRKNKIYTNYFFILSKYVFKLFDVFSAK